MDLVCVLLCSIIIFLIYKYQFKETLADKLFNSKTRGEFGEIILEDCLKRIGLVENLHYKSKEYNSDGKCPDFTLFLGENFTCYIDSKFPLQNYKMWVETGISEYLTRFKKDVRTPVCDVQKKGYNDKAGFSILFVPNDVLYQKILTIDPEFINYCTDKGVVPCSPSSVYAIIAVLKYLADFVKLDVCIKDKILLIQNFKEEWAKFKEEMVKTEKTVENLNQSFNTLQGVRTRKLDRVLC